jgi:CHAD domain-containing protein
VFDGSIPQRIVTSSLQDFMNELPGLREGDERAIHQSRVAIRRLRESLALVRPECDDDEIDSIAGRLTEMFKALGRARDADTAQRLVQQVEARFPQAAGTLGQLRASLTRGQLVARRRMIKTMESADVDALPRQVAHARRPQRPLLHTNPWRERLRLHVACRATELVMAMERAGGVYFRRRSHNARVAVKQLRYALELAGDLGVHLNGEAVRSLRKAQDALGEAHDREVVIKRLRKLKAEGVVAQQSEAAAVEQFLDGEIGALHQKYLAVRPQLREVCAAAGKVRRQLPLRAGAVAIAAVAIPAALVRRRA